MAYIYAYEQDALSCAGIGLVGALLATGASFELRAGEFGELSFTHPIDPFGKWRALRSGCVLKTMVPVRLVPEVEDGAYVASVDVYTVARTATKYQRYIYCASTAANDPKTKTKKGQKTKHKKLLKRGATVTVIADPRPNDDTYRYKVRVGSGKKRVAGYMEKAGLTLTQRAKPVPATQEGLETDAPSYAVQQQLFRVYEVEANADAGDPGSLTVRARRLVYDLLGNICTYRTTASVSCQQACRGILSNTAFGHPFTVFSDIGEKHVGIDLRDMNPIAALIDPEEGAVAHWGGEAVCDDYDVNLLRRAGMDRGTVICYGKGLEGIHCQTDDSGVATALRPVGETASGAPLYLDGHVVNGRHGYNYDSKKKTCANWLPAGFRFAADGSGGQTTGIIERDLEDDGYAVPKAASLPVPDAKVTKKTKTTDSSETSVLTTALARIMLAEAAVGQFNAGCDVPAMRLEVDFTQLGNAEEYAQYRHLEPLFVYDTVTISHTRLSVRARVQLTALTWDVAAERVSGAAFGSLGDATAKIPGWQLSPISGAKLLPGTVSSGQISAEAISAEHLQADSVNAEAIQARSITSGHLAANAVDAQAISAVTARLESINAGTIGTDTLAAALASLYAVVAQDIRAGTVQADSLSAVMAELMTVQAAVGAFDLAAVTNLVSSALTLRAGVAGSMMIANLAVTSANLLNATIGKLILKGDDGRYFAVSVGSDGTVRAADVTDDLTESEIEAGATSDGRKLVTDAVINADEINGRSVSAVSGTFDDVFTAALRAGTITAQDAMLASASIPMLYATAIEAIGSTIDISANDSILMQTGDDARGLRRILRLDSDGVHIGDSRQTNELLLDPHSLNVRVGGFTYSRFAANHAQFGDYQLRRSVDGGLVFKREG